MLAAAVSEGTVDLSGSTVSVTVSDVDPTPVDPRSLSPQEDKGLQSDDLDRISRVVY